MDRLREHYRVIFHDKGIFWNISLSILLFALSVYATMTAYDYTQATGGLVVRDLILDHIPTLNVQVLFFGGIAFLTIVPTLIAFFDPRKLPFGLEVTAMFFLIRAFFMVLTHVAPPNIQYYHYFAGTSAAANQAAQALFSVSSGTDMFFSGHTGYPFLLALVLWKTKWLRNLFLGFSVLMAATVLFGHLHYSIDVFAAYFIAYGVFRMSKRYFWKEYKLMYE
jgi:hypothetical protein